MEASINAHPRRHEMRGYMGADYLYSFLCLTREQAEREADEVKREPIAKGWTDRLVMPEW